MDYVAHLYVARTPLRDGLRAYLSENKIMSDIHYPIPDYRQPAYSVAGVFLANAVPTAWGLGFAGILALLGVLSSLASSPLRIVSAGVAGAAAVVAWALPLKLNILVAIASAVAICLVLEKAMPHRPAAGAPHV